MAKFIAALPGKTPLVSILPYHNIAAHKYNKLGSIYNEFEMAGPTDQEIEFAISIFKAFNIEVEG